MGGQDLADRECGCPGAAFLRHPGLVQDVVAAYGRRPAQWRSGRQRPGFRRQTIASRRRCEHRVAGAHVRRPAAAGRARAQVDVQRLARRRVARQTQRTWPLARLDQRQRADPGSGGARSRAVGRPSLHGPGADDTADPRNPFRQPAFRPALRGRLAKRAPGCHASDGSDAVRVDPALPGREPRALARFLRRRGRCCTCRT